MWGTRNSGFHKETGSIAPRTELRWINWNPGELSLLGLPDMVFCGRLGLKPPSRYCYTTVGILNSFRGAGQAAYPWDSEEGLNHVKWGY